MNAVKKKSSLKKNLQFRNIFLCGKKRLRRKFQGEIHFTNYYSVYFRNSYLAHFTNYCSTYLVLLSHFTFPTYPSTVDKPLRSDPTLLLHAVVVSVCMCLSVDGGDLVSLQMAILHKVEKKIFCIMYLQFVFLFFS